MMIHNRWVNPGWLALRRLEPYDAKVSSTVLKGRGCGNTALLPDNILLDKSTQKMTIIDLGETVITHPFFSLITCLRNAFFRYSLKECDIIYDKLKNSVLDSWIEFETKNELLEAFSVAEKLWPIYASLGEHRLIISSDPEKLKSMNRHGRIAIGFKEFSKQFLY